MLVLLAPGIAPVVEDLAAEEMPADAPGVAVAICHHDLLAHLDRVEIDDFEGDVIDLGFERQSRRTTCDGRSARRPDRAA